MRVALRFSLLILLALPLRGQSTLQFRGSEASARLLQHYQFQPDKLPQPSETSSAENAPSVEEKPANATLHLPPGFVITEFAADLRGPRWMAQAPNGDIFVAESRAGRITILRADKSNSRASERFVFADGLNLPFGMAFRGDYLYVGETNEVVRFRYRPGQTRAEGKPTPLIGLPGQGYKQHWTRNLMFSPDGAKLYVTVGSSGNDTPERDPRRAAINEYNADGSGHRIFASGLRNPVGLAIRPGSDELWTTVNERDGLGDDLPPDYLTSVRAGAFYGWPYAYIGPHPDPQNPGHGDAVSKTVVPDVLIQAHSAALGLAFYDGNMFPPEYRGDAFVALHGSWNRAQRTGYKIIRVHFSGEKPTGGYQDFITGWSPAPNDRHVWGRPVGLLVLKDGSMLIADDGGDRIWRVTYEKPLTH